MPGTGAVVKQITDTQAAGTVLQQFNVNPACRAHQRDLVGEVDQAGSGVRDADVMLSRQDASVCRSNVASFREALSSMSWRSAGKQAIFNL